LGSVNKIIARISLIGWTLTRKINHRLNQTKTIDKIINNQGIINLEVYLGIKIFKKYKVSLMAYNLNLLLEEKLMTIIYK